MYRRKTSSHHAGAVTLKCRILHFSAETGIGLASSRIRPYCNASGDEAATFQTNLATLKIGVKMFWVTYTHADSCHVLACAVLTSRRTSQERRNDI